MDDDPSGISLYQFMVHKSHLLKWYLENIILGYDVIQQAVLAIHFTMELLFIRVSEHITH
jgi:hypothetical protein